MKRRSFIGLISAGAAGLFLPKKEEEIYSVELGGQQVKYGRVFPKGIHVVSQEWGRELSNDDLARIAAEFGNRAGKTFDQMVYVYMTNRRG